MKRRAGLLCPIFSIPANQGIGDFGRKTEMMIDLIADAGYSIWQVLPIQMTGDTHSPYQTYSSFAGDPIYINLDRLCEMGLITQSSVTNCNKFKNRVDYNEVRAFKETYFQRAFHEFKREFDAFQYDFEAFEKRAFWLEEWAMFELFRQLEDGAVWTSWPEAYRDWPIHRSGVDLGEHEDTILYIKFLQFLFYKQFDDILMYAHSKGLKIMGDIPFYVDLNSQDVWANRDDFTMDEQGNPTFVAGCPPDYFSEDGQRWGMPTYNFDAQAKNDYHFWTNRINWIHQCFDYVRIDHFRAFDTYWKIPSSCPTAKEGQWIEAPGKELLERITRVCEHTQFVAEDLGSDMRDQMYELEQAFEIPGMEVLIFSLNVKTLRKPVKKECFLYTGTHDNETLNQAYQEFDQNKRVSLRRFFKKRGYTSRKFNELVCEYALDSEADVVILPIWDICGYKAEARINLPGSVSDENWTWKLKDFKTFPDAIHKTKEWIEKSNRS